MSNQKIWAVITLGIVVGILAAACAPPSTPVAQTRIVEQTRIIEKIVTATPAVPVSVTGSKSAHLMLTPNDLRWVDVPSLPKGAKMAVIEGPMSEAVPFTARLKFPANYKIPAHWHLTIERVTVLSGMLNMGTGDNLLVEMSTALAPGSITIIQPQVRHYAWTNEETIVQLNGTGPWDITYVNPADDPRKQ